MNQQCTELVFILDRSGSMHGLEKDTMGGFNAMIEKQRKEPGEAYVSTVLFANESKVIHDRMPLSHIPTLTERDYTVGGCTALLDAMGDAIHHIGTIHKYARKEDVPAHTLFVIITDGMENASHRYGLDDIRKKVERQKARYGWEFLFLGANLDAVSTAGQMGIDSDHAASYLSDAQGTQRNYQVLADAISDVRSSRKLDATWKREIEADYQSRKTE